MKQIKTIIKRTDDWGLFDEEVNKAIAEGWTLVKRDVLHPYEGHTYVFTRALYAELEREVVEKKQTERICETCAHFDELSHRPPCCECMDEDKWEQGT